MPLLTCHDLCLGYDGRTIVTGLNFTVNTGDYLCIVGENGSGKTTLMRTLLKLKAPKSGVLRFGGETGNDKGSTGGLFRAPKDMHANEIGYLPQQTEAQKDFPASVREVVRSGCLNRMGLRPYYTLSEKKTADEMMEKLGVARLAGRCYRELSGGQQQKVLLARAMCAARKLLLLDEPTAGLDPRASEELYTLILQLNQAGVTIIMVSHDIAASVKYASHILHIGAGTPAFFGTVAGYLKSDVGHFFSGHSAH